MSDDQPSSKNPLYSEEYVNHFRVAIFGSARIKKGHTDYQLVYDLAKQLGMYGFDVVTGGGPGMMEAANEGHQAGRMSEEAHSIGLTIQLPWETEANRHLDVRQHFKHFSNRLDEFMVLSNVAVLTHGGVGTCLEFFYTWQLVQVKHIAPIPIILLGPMWKGLVNWIHEEPLARGLISPNDMDHVYFTESLDDAMDLIIKAKQQDTRDGNVARKKRLNYRLSGE